MTFPDLVPDLRARMAELRGRLIANQPLAELTWFRVGGPAQVLFSPQDEADLAYCLARLIALSSSRVGAWAARAICHLTFPFALAGIVLLSVMTGPPSLTGNCMPGQRRRESMHPKSPRSPRPNRSHHLGHHLGLQ